VDSKEHGKRLQQRIPDSHFVSSGSRGRKATLDAFKGGVVRCVIATSILEEGFDSPIASVIVMAGAGKSFRKTLQSSGRVLRPFADKSKGIIYDFHDLGHGMLSSQHWQRRKVYSGLGYKIIKNTP